MPAPGATASTPTGPSQRVVSTAIAPVAVTSGLQGSTSSDPFSSATRRSHHCPSPGTIAKAVPDGEVWPRRASIRVGSRKSMLAVSARCCPSDVARTKSTFLSPGVAADTSTVETAVAVATHSGEQLR